MNYKQRITKFTIDADSSKLNFLLEYDGLYKNRDKYLFKILRPRPRGLGALITKTSGQRTHRGEMDGLFSEKFKFGDRSVVTIVSVVCSYSIVFIATKEKLLRASACTF